MMLNEFITGDCRSHKDSLLRLNFDSMERKKEKEKEEKKMEEELYWEWLFCPGEESREQVLSEGNRYHDLNLQ